MPLYRREELCVFGTMRLVLALLLLVIPGCCETAREVEEVHHPAHVLVQPMGAVPRVLLDSIAEALRQQHRAKVTIGTAVALPEQAFTEVRGPRYRADTLIAWLRDRKPDTVDHILGITAMDISITKYAADGSIKHPAAKYRDFGIFGLGYMNGPSCVVSTFRFGHDDDPHFFDRLCKVTVHELGHNRGLPHCSDPYCVMRDAVERMNSIDSAGRSFCRRCARTIGVGVPQP